MVEYTHWFPEFKSQLSHLLAMGAQFSLFFFAIFKKNFFCFNLAELGLIAVHKRPLIVVSGGCSLDEVASIVEHGL